MSSLEVSGFSNFYPRPPRGGRQISFSISSGISIFLSTPSARRATGFASTATQKAEISIHALREEGDASITRSASGSVDFYPRPPRGGRLPARRKPSLRQRFLSTPSARRATDFVLDLIGDFNISIHALREEGDRFFVLRPRAITDFYPRPPRGGRHAAGLLRNAEHHISIHALREEGDRGFDNQSVMNKLFLSTPSARRATL